MIWKFLFECVSTNYFLVACENITLVINLESVVLANPQSALGRIICSNLPKTLYTGQGVLLSFYREQSTPEGSGPWYVQGFWAKLSAYYKGNLVIIFQSCNNTCSLNWLGMKSLLAQTPYLRFVYNMKIFYFLQSRNWKKVFYYGHERFQAIYAWILRNRVIVLLTDVYWLENIMKLEISIEWDEYLITVSALIISALTNSY